MKLPILTERHPILHRAARKVTAKELRTPLVQRLIDDMFETMRAVGGIGLAAPQVGAGLRIFVTDLSEFLPYETPRVFVNPVVELLWAEEAEPEVCLSAPGFMCEVLRPKACKVKGWDRNGRKVRVEAEGLLARCIQHEVDHLNGILILDRASKVTISPPKKGRKW